MLKGREIVLAFASALIAGLLVVGCGGDDGSDAASGGAAADNGAATVTSDGDSTTAGGGEEEDSSDSGTISKAAFVDQARKICRAAFIKITGESSDFFEKASKGANYNLKSTEVTVVKKFLGPGLHAEVEELRELGSPPGDEDQVAAFIDSIEEVAERVEADPKGMIEESDPYKKPQALARKYGVKACPLV